MAIMRVAENNQKGFRHCIDKSKRFLRKARDFYVDSMVSFEGKVAHTNVVVYPAVHISHLPTDIGHQSSAGLIDRENLDEFYLLISEKYTLSRSISEKYSRNNVEFDEDGTKQRVDGYGAMERSYSVGLGKIGTIDEEEPFDFQEDFSMKREILFSRCRSHAVSRKNGSYY